MNRIRINDKISYIEASDNPLSADIGMMSGTVKRAYANWTAAIMWFCLIFILIIQGI